MSSTPDERPGPDREIEGAALALVHDGRVAEKRRELRSALDCYESALAALAEDATPLRSQVLRWRGSVLRDMGLLAEADVSYQEALTAARACGSIADEAAAVNCRAAVAQSVGSPDRAAELYGQAASLAAEAGDTRLLGMIEQNLGVLANIRGDLHEAFLRYSAALRAFKETCDDEARSWVLNNLGMVLTDLGFLDRAEASFEEGLAIARSRGDLPTVGILQTNLGETLLAARRWDEGAEALQSAVSIADAGQDLARSGEARKLLGALEHERGSFDAAENVLSEALEVARTAGSRLLIAEILRERGDLRRRQGRDQEAREDWRAAEEGFLAVGAALDAVRMRGRLSGHMTPGRFIGSGENGAGRTRLEVIRPAAGPVYELP